MRDTWNLRRQKAPRSSPGCAALPALLERLPYSAGKALEEAARELHRFQQLKKSQEGTATPEDMEWSEYAEIYDPVKRVHPRLENAEWRRSSAE